MQQKQVALVTGGGAGIGEAICHRLAADGMAVGVVDARPEAAAAVADAIRAAGGEAMPLAANVTDSDQVAAVVAQVVERYGGLHVLVNNAGIVRDSRLVKMEPEQWDAVIDVNLGGAVNCLRHVAPVMVRQEWGRVVSIASRALLGNFGQCNYAATKSGLVGFSRGLAVELGPHNITVNVVAPGLIDTALTRSVDPRVMEKAAKAAPLRRAGSVQEVANVVWFLASDLASYVTGQTLFVCGGRSLLPALEMWA